MRRDLATHGTGVLAIVLVIALVIAFATGCNGILGIGSVASQQDASAIDAPVDAAPSKDIAGSSILHARAPGYQAEQPQDLSKRAIAAWFVDPQRPGTFTKRDGTGAADGTFVIPDVPQVGYWLQISPQLYYWTQSRTPDMGFTLFGRLDRPQATSSTPLELKVGSSMPTWSFDRYSVVADAGMSYANFVSGRPKPGEHGVVDGLFDAFSSHSVAGPLLMANDELWVTHLRQQDLDVRTDTTRIAEFARFPAVTQTDGQLSLLSGTFAAPPTATTRIAFSVPSLRGAFTDWVFSHEVVATVSVTPADATTAAAGAVLGNGELYSLRYTAKRDDASQGFNLSYPDPFPAAWTRLVSVDYHRYRYVNLTPNDAYTAQLETGAIGKAQLLSATVTLDASLRPPAAITIDGAPATQHVVAFDGVAPIELTWQPVTGADSYSITVDRIYVDNGSTAIDSVANFYLSSPAASLPAQLFAADSHYAFEISAVRGGPTKDAPRSFHYPSQYASVTTEIMLFSAHCGDGHTDPGEDCDAGGESATCNFDCTAARCQDGLLNRTAGEFCDVSNENRWHAGSRWNGVYVGMECDASCQYPICSDHHTDGPEEGCDDGNSTSGDGCSATCQVENPNQCGNSVVDPGEECDEAGKNTATCTSHCMTPYCGDGIVTAPEQCDTGLTAWSGTNGIDDGTCSYACMFD